MDKISSNNNENLIKMFPYSLFARDVPSLSKKEQHFPALHHRFLSKWKVLEKKHSSPLLNQFSIRQKKRLKNIFNTINQMTMWTWWIRMDGGRWSSNGGDGDVYGCDFCCWGVESIRAVIAGRFYCDKNLRKRKTKSTELITKFVGRAQLLFTTVRFMLTAIWLLN